MRPVEPLTLLGLVFLVHLFVLWGLQQKLQTNLVMKPLPEPVFLHLLQPKTRLIKPAKNQRSAAPTRSTPTNPATTLVSAEPTVGDPNSPDPPSQDAPLEPPGSGESVADPSPDSPPSTGTTQDAMAASATDVSKPEPLTSDTWPADTRVSYVLRGFYRGEVHGSAKVQWQRQEERYQVQLDMRMALLFQVSLTSQGRVSTGGLIPEAYEERFLAARRTVAFEDELLRLQDGRKLAKPAGVQDTASQFVELSHRFATGRQTLAVGEMVTVWLARPGGVDRWTYDVVESVGLTTPQLGLVQAFHLKPRPLANPRGDIVAEIWLAPSLQYLPVRVRIALGGDNFVDLLVETIEQGDAPPSPQLPARFSGKP